MPRESLALVRIDGRDIACAETDAGGAASVVVCHGFRGDRIGPNRTFVALARRLGALGISSVRFDQWGSGDSGGEFIDSRFDDWVALTAALVRRERDRGRRVALLGQSMGGAAAICAAPDLPVEALVAWVPDPNVDPFAPDPRGWSEEGGQRVADAYWQQAVDADVPARLRRVPAPCLLVFGTEDEYVSAANRQALIAATKPSDEVDVHEGWPHSTWTAEQADAVLDRSTAFLAAHLRGSAGD